MFYLQKLYWHFLCYMRCRSSSLSLFAYRKRMIQSCMWEKTKKVMMIQRTFFWCQTRYGIASAAGDFGESRVVLNQHKLALLGRFFFLSCPHTPFSLNADFSQEIERVTQTSIATHYSELGRRRICSNH